MMANSPASLGEFSTVVADPPWQPELGKTWDSRLRDKAGPQRFYDTLDVEQIIELRPNLAKQAHVYIWGVCAHMDWAFQVARAWGAEPVTMLTWKKPGLGAGRFRCNTEHVLVARRGQRAGNPFGSGGRTSQATAGTLFGWPSNGGALLDATDDACDTLYEWPRGAHSQKPDGLYKLVERLSPGPLLEMYARSPRLGWTVWGREADGVVAAPKAPSRRTPSTWSAER